MAIKRRVPDPARREHKEVTMPVFSYFPNDGLAQLIVDAWTDPGQLLDRDPHTGNPTAGAVQEATQKVNSLGGFNLQRAVVISEQEHDNDYTMQTDTEVVFVLPNANRKAAGGTGLSLLNTARLLMACTPNGI